jgi:hypothetical protein
MPIQILIQTIRHQSRYYDILNDLLSSTQVIQNFGAETPKISIGNVEEISQSRYALVAEH